MYLKTAVTFAAICIPFFLLTVWAIVDAAQKDFGTTGRKALWVLIAGVPFIGFIPYFLIGFRKGRKPGASELSAS